MLRADLFNDYFVTVKNACMKLQRVLESKRVSTMNRFAISFGALSTILALPAFSAAGLFFEGANSYSTAAGSAPGGKLDARTDLLTSDLYINSLSLSGGTFGSSGLSLEANGGYFQQYDSGSNLVGGAYYYFGTPLAAGYSYDSLGVFNGLFGFSGPGVAGTYTGTVDVLGGSSSSASDLLATVSFTVEVVSGFGLAITYPTNNFTVGIGQTAMLQNRVVNSSSRNFLVNSRYFSYSTAPSGFTINFENYPSSFAANSDVTVDSLSFTGVSSGPQWTGIDNGVFGGYYSDDLNDITGGGAFTVNPVPEPATLTILGLGGLALVRRRRGNR